jgi:hypothetical protein
LHLVTYTTMPSLPLPLLLLLLLPPGVAACDGP